MIATILPSSTNFHAVEYNEMKVAKGKAELIEMSNFGYIGMLGNCQAIFKGDGIWRTWSTRAYIRTP